jgi:hypothetical protein
MREWEISWRANFLRARTLRLVVQAANPPRREIGRRRTDRFASRAPTCEPRLAHQGRELGATIDTDWLVPF